LNWPAAFFLALLAATGRAATAYVSDELVLGVYSEPNGQGQRLATLHSGAAVEALGVSGDFTEVRLGDGTSGWVKSAYLMPREPAVVRVKRLEEELDRTRATTPALAEAAAHSEMERLKQALAGKQAELDAARKDPGVPQTGTAESGAAAGAMTGGRPRGISGGTSATSLHLWMPATVGVAALGCGFWLGYATLARRIKHKFGGIKVY
jgi:hypothetical protein